tara:strand:+ start:174 stop:482 length:309 start_codon:yes stop_codon:yes gene_type:complete
MDIDLKSKEGQDKFIEESMSNLLQGINDSYGPLLVEELTSRIRKTIDEFNSEIVAAFDELKNKEADRQKVYNMIKEGNIPADDSDTDKKNPDWEEKIEEVES